MFPLVGGPIEALIKIQIGSEFIRESVVRVEVGQDTLYVPHAY